MRWQNCFALTYAPFICDIIPSQVWCSLYIYLWLIPSYIVSSLPTDFVREPPHHLHSDLVPNNLHSDHVHCFFHACVFVDFLVVTELSIFLLLSKNKDQCKSQMAQDSYLIDYTARHTFKKQMDLAEFLALSTSLIWKNTKTKQS